MITNKKIMETFLTILETGKSKAKGHSTEYLVKPPPAHILYPIWYVGARKAEEDRGAHIPLRPLRKPVNSSVMYNHCDLVASSRFYLSVQLH